MSTELTIVHPTGAKTVFNPRCLGQERRKTSYGSFFSLRLDETLDLVLPPFALMPCTRDGHGPTRVQCDDTRL
jgi:hypothetical protein